jgi:hypothetical protein
MGAPSSGQREVLGKRAGAAGDLQDQRDKDCSRTEVRGGSFHAGSV